MNDLNKDIFIQTVMNTQKNENLEKKWKENEQRAEKLRSFTGNKNTFIKTLSLIFFFTVLFFIIPVLITGFLTKGWQKTDEESTIPEYQKLLWMTIFFILILYFLKKNIIT